MYFKTARGMKQLFIISKESRAARFGIGTYIRQLIECFDLSLWCIHVVELNASVEGYVYKEEDGVFYSKISLPVYVNEWDLEKERLYYRGVFYWLASLIPDDREVFCHFNFARDYELARLLKEKLNVTIFFTLHYMEWSFDLLGNSEKLLSILSNPTDREEEKIVNQFKNERRFMADCCDSIITISKHTLKLLQTLYGIPDFKLVHIPLGLKDKYIKRSEAELKRIRKKYLFTETDRLILYVGRLSDGKGLCELIQAFRLLSEKDENVRLIISGNGDFNRYLVVSAPYWGRITFTGFLTEEQLGEMYAIADIGVVPSLHEELGYVPIEMMMHRLPVICSNATGLLEVTANGEFGQLVNWTVEHQSVKLLEVLVEWLLYPKLYQRFRDIGRLRFLKEYSFDRFQEKIILLYHI